MRSNRTQWFALSAAAVAATIFVTWPRSVLYVGPAWLVEKYLLRQTPLGESEQQVTRWRATRGIDAHVAQADVKAGGDFPPTTVGGTAFIQAPVADYWLPLRTTVEAFYIFNSAGTLADLRVRRTIDAP